MLLAALLLTASCAPEPEALRDYAPYGKIPAGYSLEDAKADGCVVYEDGSIASGQAVWEEFLKKTEAGTSCMVRLGFYYTIGNPSQYAPELYEDIKDDYPVLYIQDLTYDGTEYTLYSVEDDKEYRYRYSYMKKFEGPYDGLTSTSREEVRYVLVNDAEVTWEEIFRGMVSSRFGDAIDHQTVYVSQA